jgi:hypothetical protein
MLDHLGIDYTKIEVTSSTQNIFPQVKINEEIFENETALHIIGQHSGFYDANNSE